MEQYHQNSQKNYHFKHNSYSHLSNEEDYFSYGRPQTFKNNLHNVKHVKVIEESV